MADRRPWSTKRKMKERSAKLVAAKRVRASGEDSRATVTPPSSELDIASTSTSVEQAQRECEHPELPEDPCEDASVVEGPDVSSDEYQSEDDTFDDERVQDIFDEFILSFPIDNRRMLAVLLAESFRTRQGMGIVYAAREAGSIVGYSDKTVRKLRKQFYENKGVLRERTQGKYERVTIYRDEELNEAAAKWVRENAFTKGKPNMTAQSFCQWANEELLPSSQLPPHFPWRISLRTAVRWLHYLGFKPVSHRKGVYIDGHERDDVVKHRANYLRTMAGLQATHRPPPICSDEPPPTVRDEREEEKKDLVVIYHDESIYNSNEGQTWMWGEEERPALLPKTKGSGLMVSDFVDEHDGFLCLSHQQHQQAKATNPSIQQHTRVVFEYGSERGGYWTGDRFMAQMKTACDIAEIKYPSSTHTVVFVLDQSSCHRKFDEKALVARNILVKDGGPRRVRDTVWAGQPQSMVMLDGSAKGLRTILQERGINTSTLKADDMRIILSNHDDFVNEKTQVEHYVISRGFQCYFLPKFHCELNPIERVWGQSKRYCRAYSNFTLVKLREVINPALDSVSTDLIRKYFRKVREYERAYLEGHKAGKEVEAAVKLYKSHCRVFSEAI